MKKFLMILGGVFLLLIVAVGVTIAIFAVQGNQLDKESKAYAEATLPMLLSDFTTDTFLKYVAPENRNKVDRLSMDKLAATINNGCGHYKSFRDLHGDSLLNLNVSGGKREITAKYVMTIEFEKATATGQVILLKSNGKWSVMRIDFNIPLAQTAPTVNNAAGGNAVSGTEPKP